VEKFTRLNEILRASDPQLIWGTQSVTIFWFFNWRRYHPFLLNLQARLTDLYGCWIWLLITHIRLDPTDVFAYYNRGVSWNEKGEPDKAIEDITEAIRLDPTYAHAYRTTVRGFTSNSER
jgi:tetratricopeptide (TPR) repeat protein